MTPGRPSFSRRAPDRQLTARSDARNSGDGAKSEYSAGGFVRPIEAALRVGFDVEIVGWRSGLNAVWPALERSSNARGARGGRLRVILLDDFAEELLAG